MNVLITSASRKVWLVRAFQRAAEAEGGGIVVAVDASPYSPALLAADKAHLVPHGLGEDFFERIMEIAASHGVGLIVPTRDEELPAFARRKSMFSDAGVHVMAAGERAIGICQDKRAFSEWCIERGFQVPAIVDPSSPHLSFPAFVRNRVGKAGRAAFRADGREELECLLRSLPDPIVQEYVDADEYTVDVFADFDGRVLSATPRLRISTFGGESFVGKTVEHPQIMQEAARLVESLGLVGFATVQCFWHEQAVKFIELNPRIGGGAHLSIAAGADTPRMALRAAAGKPAPPSADGFQEGLVMLRHTEDVFIAEDDLHARFRK